MASIAIVIGTAIAFAASNLGAHYLQKAIDGDDNSGADIERERERHDKALEKYQKDMGEWEKQRTKLRDWEEQRDIAIHKVEQDLHRGDEALTLYARTHPEPFLKNKPEFENYYKPSKRTKKYEMVFVGASTLAISYAAARFF